MEQCRRDAEAKYPAPPYVQLPDGLDEVYSPDVRHIKQWAYAQALYDERSKAKAPQYTRQGPPIQMQDVLLAFGELNERERVAVQWVLDKVNALPGSNGLTVAEVMDVVGPLCLGDATSSAIRSKLTAIRQSKSK
jgi:hypothetical protein